MRYSQPRVAASIVKAAAAVIAAALIVVGSAVAPASAVDTTIYGQVLLGSVSSSVPAGAGEVLVEFTKYPNVHNPSDFVPTAADGTYSINGLANGSYYLRYHYVGSGSFSDMGTKGAVPGFTPWEEAVAPSATTPRNVYLPAQAELGGTVWLGATAAGAGDVAVYYQQLNEVWGTEVGPVYTDAAGHYSFGTMPAGIFTFRFDYVGSGNFMGRTWADGPSVVMQKRAGYFRGASAPFSANAALAPPITISGTASLSDSEWLAGSTPAGAGVVTVSYAQRNFETGTDIPLGSTTTDAAGHYSIPGLVNLYGYRLTFSAPNYFPLTTQPDGAWSHEYQSFDVSETIYRSYTVSGHIDLGSVRSAGAGDVEVTLHDAETPYGALPDVTTVTDSAGNYSFSGLPGKYYTFALNYVGAEDFLDTTPALPIPRVGTNGVWMPTSGDHTRDFVVPKGNQISGIVRGPANQLLADVPVILFEFTDFGDSYSLSQLAETTTDANGQYTFTGLHDGQYGVGFNDPDYAYQSWPQVSRFLEPNHFPVNGGEHLTGIDATLRLPGTITGVVSAPSLWFENPADHRIVVSLLYFDPTAGRWNTGEYTYPDSSGNYTFSRVSPGSYKVRVSYFVSPAIANKVSAPLSVATNQTVHFNVLLAPAQVLTPGDLVKAPGAAALYLVNDPEGPLIPVPPAVQADFGLSAPKTVLQAQIDNYVIADFTLSNLVYCGWSSYLLLAAEGKVWPVYNVLVGDAKYTYLTPAACSGMHLGTSTIESSPLLTSPAGVVYAVLPDGKKHRVLTSSTIGLRLTPNASRVFTVSDYFLSTIATGATVLPPGRIVRGPSMVKYFVDGFDRLVPITSYDVTTSMGLPQSFLPVTSTDLLGYQIEPPSAELTNTIACPNGTYFAASGKIWQIDPLLVGSLPQTTLSAAACASLQFDSAILGGLFVQSSTSAATYFITETGEKRQISGRVSMGALSYPYTPTVVRAADSFLNSLPTGPPIVPYLGKMPPAGQAPEPVPTMLLESTASASPLSVAERVACYSDYFQAIGVSLFAPLTRTVLLAADCRRELALG